MSSRCRQDHSTIIEILSGARHYRSKLLQYRSAGLHLLHLKSALNDFQVSAIYFFRAEEEIFYNMQSKSLDVGTVIQGSEYRRSRHSGSAFRLELIKNRVSSSITERSFPSLGLFPVRDRGYVPRWLGDLEEAIRYEYAMATDQHPNEWRTNIHGVSMDPPEHNSSQSIS